MTTARARWKTSHAKEVNCKKLNDKELWTSILYYIYLHVKKRNIYRNAGLRHVQGKLKRDSLGAGLEITDAKVEKVTITPIEKPEPSKIPAELFDMPMCKKVSRTKRQAAAKNMFEQTLK